jgi:hypothetical protein
MEFHSRNLFVAFRAFTEPVKSRDKLYVEDLHGQVHCSVFFQNICVHWSTDSSRGQYTGSISSLGPHAR